MRKYILGVLISAFYLLCNEIVMAQNTDVVYYNGSWYEGVGENLIANPSFEEGLSEWTSANDFETFITDENFQLVTEDAQDGNYCLRSRYSTGATSTSSLGTAWEIEPGKTYLFTFYLKYVANGEIPTTEYLKVSLSDYQKGDETKVLPYAYVTENNTWTKYQVAFTNVSSKYLQVKFRWMGDAWCFDNFSLCEAEKTESQTRIACVGNSITEGLCIADPSRDSYPAQLGQILGAGYEVGNFGVSGRTLLKKGDYPYWNEPAFVESQSFNPDVVIIKLGTNDTKPYNWKYGAEFEDNLQELVDVYKNLSSAPKVYLAYPAKIFYNTYDIHDEVVTGEMMPIIDRVAERNGLDIIDFHSAYEGKQYFMTQDGVHPNEKGATMMAELVKSELVESMLCNPGFEEMSAEESGMPEGWTLDNVHNMEICINDNQNHYLSVTSPDAETMVVYQALDNLPLGEYKLRVKLKTTEESKAGLYVMINGKKTETEKISTGGQWTEFYLDFKADSYLTTAQVGVSGTGDLQVDDFSLYVVPQKLLDVYNGIISDYRSALETMQESATGALKDYANDILEETVGLELQADTLAKAVALLQEVVGSYGQLISDYSYVESVVNGLQDQLLNLEASQEVTDDCMVVLQQAENALFSVCTAEDIRGVLSDAIAGFEKCLANAKVADGKTLDMTFFIKNPQVSSTEGWTNPSTASGNQYFGAPDNLYLDRWNALLDTYQDVVLPSGIYKLTAATRASEQISDCYLYARTSDNTYKQPVLAIGSSGGNLGNGWNWSDIENININGNNNMLRIGFYANAVNYQWASVDMFSLSMVETISQSVGIENILKDEDSVVVYTLDGTLRREAGNYEEAVKGLGKGCFVINGRCTLIQ